MKSKQFIILLFFIPILFYYAYIYYYAVNVPHIFDDYDTFLAKTYFILQSSNPFDFFTKLIYANGQGHRLFFDSLITIVDLKLEKHINFRTLVMIGDLILLSIVYFYYLTFNHKKNFILYFIPAVFILFNPINYNSFFWPTASLQYVPSTACIFWGFYLSIKTQKTYFISSLLLYTIGCLTCINAILFFPIAILLLFYRQKYLRLLILLALGSWLIYMSLLAGKNDSSTIEWNLPRQIKGGFEFIGNIVYFLPNALIGTSLNVSFVAGVIIFCFCCYTIFRAFKNNGDYIPSENNIIIIASILYIFATDLAGSILRGGSTLDYGNIERYLFYSQLIVVSTYILYVNIHKPSLYTFKFILLASIVFCSLAYYHYHAKVVDYSKHWLLDNRWATIFETDNRIKNLYNVPEKYKVENLKNYSSINEFMLHDTINDAIKITSRLENNTIIISYDKTYNPLFDANKFERSFIFKDVLTKKDIIFSADIFGVPFSQFIKGNFNYYRYGLSTTIIYPFAFFQHRKYRIGFLITDKKGKSVKLWTKKHLDL